MLVPDAILAEVRKHLPAILERRAIPAAPAVALCLKCPVWTEDTDFFGIGIPTWTTRHVEIFLASGPGSRE